MLAEDFGQLAATQDAVSEAKPALRTNRSDVVARELSGERDWKRLVN